MVKPKAIIVDIDGTIADMQKGVPGKRSPFDWDRVGEDFPNENVIDIVFALSMKYEIIIVSGRDEICESETMKWLEDNGVPCDELFMRRHNDNRPDHWIKREIYETKIAQHWNVIAVLDDRDKVVDMWRALGLTCLQVADGNF